MRLYTERIKMLNAIHEDCYNAFMAGDCGDCPAHSMQGCRINEPYLWDTDALSKRKRGGKNAV